MNFTYPLNHILGQLSKIKILRFLIKSGVSMNGREIGKAVGLSHVRCHTILKELSEQGIVSLRRIGRSTVYEIQEDHIVVKDWLEPLFRKEELLVQNLAQVVIDYLTTKPLSIILFGSIAKNQDQAGSDIDLLLIMPGSADLKRCNEAIMKSEEQVTKLYGNHLSPLFIKHSAFIKKLKKGDPFFQEVLKYGHSIYGLTFTELLTNEAQ